MFHRIHIIFNKLHSGESVKVIRQNFLSIGKMIVLAGLRPANIYITTYLPDERKNDNTFC